MRKIVLLLLFIMSVCLFANTEMVTKVHINEERAEQIKEARQKIEDLRAKGELVYVENNDKNTLRAFANNIADEQKRVVFETFVKSSEGGFSENEMWFHIAYPIIAVLLVGYFLLIKKIRLF